jgi:hypothetical protein
MISNSGKCKIPRAAILNLIFCASFHKEKKSKLYQTVARKMVWK